LYEVRDIKQELAGDLIQIKLSLWNALSDYMSSEMSIANPMAEYDLTALYNGNWIKASVKSKSYNGKNIFIVVFQDYNEAYLLHKKLNDSKNRTIMIAGASHELRIPLTHAISAIDVIKQQASKELEQYVNIVVSSAQFLLNAVNDILVIFETMISFRISLRRVKDIFA
jgi:signal transduction histidine kinase